MAEQLLDNVYQVGGATITHELDGASYLVLNKRSPEKSLLIDCGSPLGFGELTKQLASFDISTDTLTDVWGTHAHYDHVAAASLMQAATLRIHKDDRTAVATGNTDLTASFLYNKDFPPIANHASLHDNSEVTVSGTVIRSIHTPGHTPGSSCFKLTTESGQRILIGGDTIWGGFEARIHSDEQAWRSSLDRLLADEFDYVTFGHGISYLVPNAMAHLALAKERFMVSPQSSHGGEYIDPWQPARTDATGLTTTQ